MMFDQPAQSERQDRLQPSFKPNFLSDWSLRIAI